jgi:multidrug efflux pump subunit AcrA (membrane-fusion protein)
VKHLNWLAIIPVILGVLFFKNMVKNRAAPQKVTEPEAAIVVRVEAAEEQALPRALKGFGTVVSAREWTAIPQISGKVTYVHPNLRTGEQVGADEVLFTVETVDQGLEQQRILADQRALQAEIAQLNRRGKQLKSSLNVAHGTLKSLEREVQRYEKLFQQGATPESTLDARRRDVLNQQRAIEDIETNITTIPHQIKAVQARKDANYANIQKQSVQVGRSVVRSPFNGRLNEVYLEKGQVVNAGSQLFTLQGDDQVRVEARFPQSQLGTFPILGASVTTPGGRTVPATVGPLREQVDPVSRTASVQLLLDSNVDKVLLPGALVGVTLDGPARDPYPVIPRVALHNGFVFVVQEGRLKQVPVEEAFREGDLVAIKSGIRKGEQVVTSDPGLAMDGSLVTVATSER